MHFGSAEVLMCLEQNVAFIRQLLPKSCRYTQNLLLLKKLLMSLHFTLVDKLSDQLNA